MNAEKVASFKERMLAYWTREETDRALISVMSQTPYKTPYAGHQYYNSEGSHQKMLAEIGHTKYFGEAMAAFLPYFGTAGIAEYVGCPANYTDRTVWFEPFLEEPDAAQILVKYEGVNVGGSVKTRTAWQMIEEAEKYLGYPYVWGGSSPSTSFDCSGFVSYVLNNCGVGWNVGRLGASGLLGICTRVSSANVQPGDLIFFEGTYDTTGASHVGIYVGNNMMIHCGDPIQYARIDTSYWQSHFLAFGRLPSP